MGTIFIIGVGAGLVSALLFGVVITGSPLAMLLSVVAPLPIFIAALGWNQVTGLIAAVSGGLALAAALNLTAGVAFTVGWALPAWWLAYLALLGRPAAGGERTDWYPLGRLLVWIALTAALITYVGVLAIGRLSYATFTETLRHVFDGVLQGQGTSEGTEASLTLRILIEALPLFFALNFVMILTLNLWLAGKAVRLSDRLPRPWPDIPATAMSPRALAALAFFLGLSFAPGLLGAAGMVLAGAFFAAFVLQGLAFVHDTTRQRPSRRFMLGGLYLITFFLSQIAMPLLAILGCADAAFALRARFKPGAAGPPSP